MTGSPPVGTRTQRWLAAQRAMRDVLGDAASIEEVMPSVLRVIGEAMAWNVGEFWQGSPDAAGLRRTATWHTEGFDARALLDASARLELTRGTGLPGRAWESDQALRVADVQLDPSFLRAPEASQAGLRGAFAVPFTAGGAPGEPTVGVAVFFTRGEGADDPDTLAWLTALGGELGQFALRRRAEREARDAGTRLRQAFEGAATGMVVNDLDGCMLEVNDAFCTFVGRSRDALVGTAYHTVTHPDDAAVSEALVERLLSGTEASCVVEKRYVHSSGRTLWGRVSVSLARDAVDAPLYFVALVEDATDRKAVEALRTGEARLLEQMAGGAPLHTLLEQITLFIESQAPGMTCSILLLDADGVHLRHGAAPGLPEAYLRAIDGAPIGPSAGSCGTAMYRRAPVIVTDVRTDPLWSDYQDVGLPSHLRACWSTPIRGPDEAVLGAFAMYYGESRGPTAAEERLTAIATHLAGVAIARARTDDALRVSEELYHLLTDSSTDLISLTDPAGRVVFVNPSVRPLLGTDAAQVIGTYVFDAIHPDDVPAARTAWAGALAGGATTFAHRARHADGSWRSMDGWGRRVQFRGQPHVLVVSRDVTELQRSRDALLLFRALLDQTNDGIEVIDPETGRFLDVNEQECRLHGFSREEFLAFSIQDIDPTVSDWTPESIRRQMAEHKHLVFESQRRRKNGSVFPVEVSLSWIHLDRDYQLAVVRDNTERKKTESALRHSQADYAALIDSVEGIVWEADSESFRFSFVSQQAERLLGYPVGKWLEEPTFWQDHIHPDDRAAAVGFCTTAVREGRDHEFEYRMIAADGGAVWLRDIVSLVTREDQPTRLRGLMVDVTAARTAQDALRASEARFRTAVTAMVEGLVLTGTRGVIEFANDAFCRTLGRSRAEVEGHPAAEFAATPEDAALLESKLGVRAAAVPDRYEVGFRTARGTIVPTTISGGPLFDAYGRITGSVAVIADTTEQREIEGRLRQAQKMEAVGRLAGGVAHDFNNILTAVINYADLLLASPVPPPGWREDLAEIRTAGGRAADLTRQLLAFSRQTILQPRVFEVNRTLAGVERMLRRLIGEDVELVIDLDPEAGCILADPGQIEQVVVNLAVNARDAMPGGGRITMRTAATEMEAAVTAEYSIVGPGPYVLIAVSDTGLGMDEATQARIFEPFFTTKELGKGTGLGLATVYGIVKQAQGYINVASSPGQGTTFEVYLPRAEGRPVGERPRAPVGREGGSARILLVEDDAGVRKVTRELLDRHGYEVLSVDGPTAAIAAVEQCGGRIDLMVTDIVMPEMNGRDLADRITRDWPGIKVLYMSGYSGERTGGHGDLEPGHNFLPKPFTIDELLATVRSVLGS
ncbi:MAG: PAS domain S-box protein [Gemmatimonadales bacterium]|nr:PAS domain S-box protein [Gemmatimonadales bacterium]MDZ4390223.1 PAS domain S-box protein [Gemmatimonadales bacterium]